MRCYLLLGLVLWLCGCGAPAPLPNSNPTPDLAMGSGQLFRWSQQTAVCSKKLLFIHGRFLTDTNPNGQTHEAVEELFSAKLNQLDWVCKEQLSKPLSEVVEVWYYTYNTHQDATKITADLARLLQQHPEFRNSEICVVGFSEGGVVTWLLDQHYRLIKGGILLGAPILSTPLANPALVDQAARRVMPSSLVNRLTPVINWLLGGSDNLTSEYPGTAKSELMMFAGRIPLPNPPNITLDLMDAVMEWVDSGKYGYGPQGSNREAAEIGAILINAADWRSGEPQDKQSDGLVPISSAISGSSHYRIWSGYDHYDLLGGIDDLVLDRATFEWVDHVLGLCPEFAEETNIPALPEIQVEIPNLLANAKFAYIQSGQVCLADENWGNPKIISAIGTSYYPRFNGTGTKLVWTQTVQSFSDLYVLDGGVARSVTSDGVSWYADFSPNGEWLTYQSAGELVIHRLTDNTRYIVMDEVNLIAPPLWINAGLTGWIYFSHRDTNDQINLYRVSPRERSILLSETELVAENCQSTFLVRGGALGGILAIQNQSDGAQRIWIVSNSLASPFTLEIKTGEELAILPSDDQTSVTLQLDRAYSIESAAIELRGIWPYVYWVDTAGDQLGIYYLDVPAYLQNDNPQFEEIFKLVAPDAYHLDLKP